MKNTLLDLAAVDLIELALREQERKIEEKLEDERR